MEFSTGWGLLFAKYVRKNTYISAQINNFSTARKLEFFLPPAIGAGPPGR